MPKTATVTIKQTLVGRVQLDVDVDEDDQPLDDHAALMRRAQRAVQDGDARLEWESGSVQPMLAWYDDELCRPRELDALTPWCATHDDPMLRDPRGTGRLDTCYTAQSIAQERRFEHAARIRAALHPLYPTHAEKEAWLNSPHPLLGDATAASLIDTEREPDVWAVIEQLTTGAVV